MSGKQRSPKRRERLVFWTARLLCRTYPEFLLLLSEPHALRLAVAGTIMAPL